MSEERVPWRRPLLEEIYTFLSVDETNPLQNYIPNLQLRCIHSLNLGSSRLNPGHPIKSEFQVTNGFIGCVCPKYHTEHPCNKQMMSSFPGKPNLTEYPTFLFAKSGNVNLIAY